MKTYKGILLDCNLFEDESGNRMKVSMMKHLYLEYKDQLPLQCFILLDNGVIHNIFSLNV